MENTIGKRIAANRKRMGMTQEQLAERLGITAQAISKWENDQSCPDISMLPTLADIFGISTDALLGRIQLPNQTASRSQTHHTDCIHDDDDDDDDDDRHVHINIDTDKHSDRRYLIGLAILFLVVGGLYLCSKINNWGCSLWDILWPCSLLVFGICGLTRRLSLFWAACTGIGAFFLVNNIIPIPVNLDNGIMWAAVIILCGVTLLIDTLRKKHKKIIYSKNADHSHEYWVEDGYIHCSNQFGSENQVVVTNELKGGNISTRFGEYTLDFSGVEAVSDNCTIEASCSFGVLEFKVPRHYRVVHKTATAFADFDVKGSPDAEVRGEICLHGSVNFGSIQITYI